MNKMMKLALPMMVAGGIGMSMPFAQAEPTVIPAYQLAQVDLNNNGKSDLGQVGDGVDQNNMGKIGDGVDQNNVGDGVDQNNVGNGVNNSEGMTSLDDNVRGPADADDAERSTYDATFWVLMALLAVGIIAMIIAATRRRTTVH